MSSPQKTRSSSRRATTASRMSRPAAKRPQGRRDAALSSFSSAMPKRTGATKSRGRGRSKAKQGTLEQMMGRVAGAASGKSKRGPAIMALVGAGGAGLAALGKKRKAQGEVNEPPPGPQVHVGAEENAEPVVVEPTDVTGQNAGA